jgi:hypothetical protein
VRKQERENWFLFIQEYLAFQRYRLSDFALEIRRCCFDHFRREAKSNVVKRAALEPVITIVRLQLPLLTADKLEIRTMATTLLETYSIGRQAATLKVWGDVCVGVCDVFTLTPSAECDADCSRDVCRTVSLCNG